MKGNGHMKRVLITLIVSLTLLPCTGNSAGNCGIIEYPDHLEANCTGTPALAPATSTTTAKIHSPETPQEPTIDIASSAVKVHAGSAKTEVKAGYQPKPTPSHSQRRIAADIIDAAKAARTEKIMRSQP